MQSFRTSALQGGEHVRTICLATERECRNAQGIIEDARESGDLPFKIDSSVCMPEPQCDK